MTSPEILVRFKLPKIEIGLHREHLANTVGRNRDEIVNYVLKVATCLVYGNNSKESVFSNPTLSAC